jgi:glycosyltransferase involved in cell wall biosynthesis
LNKNLHILFLCSWYPSKVSPTNGDFIQRHAEAVNLEHNVSVLHIVSDKTISKSKIENNTVNNINTFIGYIKYTSNPLLKLIRFFNMYQQLINMIAPFDLIHLNVLFPFGLFALHQKKIKKKPFIISEHWTGYLKPQHKEISFFKKTLSKIITRNASVVCPVSENLKNSMLEFGLKGNYNPIPNVVDTNLFIPKDSNKQAFTIIHVSNMNDEHKNISGMLKVARKLEDEIPNSNWKFIGGEADQFSQLIKQLNFKRKSINFINHISQKELTTHFQNANLFVLFSNYENLPCVILEAFSSGLPGITTDVGGISEYFPSDFGYLIEKNNSKQLTKRVVDIYNKPFNDKSKMHLYAKNNFSKSQIAKSFTNLYYRTLNIEN